MEQLLRSSKESPSEQCQKRETLVNIGHDSYKKRGQGSQNSRIQWNSTGKEGLYKGDGERACKPHKINWLTSVMALLQRNAVHLHLNLQTEIISLSLINGERMDMQVGCEELRLHDSVSHLKFTDIFEWLNTVDLE